MQLRAEANKSQTVVYFSSCAQICVKEEMEGMDMIQFLNERQSHSFCSIKYWDQMLEKWGTCIEGLVYILFSYFLTN